MNRVGNQFLSRTGFSAQQHRRVCPGHLSYLFVDLAQRMRVTDDVTKIVALAQLLLQMHVFIQQALLVGFDQVIDFDCLSDHRRDNRKKLRRSFIVAIRFVF